MRFGQSVTARILTTMVAAAIVMAIPAGSALAAGTGDDPTPTADVLTTQELLIKEALEAESAGITVPDAPYRYLYTPTHAQEKSYWCGPATVQTIDDYLGSHASQADIAKHMGTTADGTDFSKVDDELRYRTGYSVYYYGDLSQTGFNTKVEHSIFVHGMPLATDVNIKGDLWPNYKYDHPGHILPIEAFDWRYMTLRVNDPYNESAWRSGGGATLGHRVYSQAVVWAGVDAHWRSAVVCAP